MTEISPQIKFQLEIVRFHVLTELIKRLVVGALFHVRQLMHNNHAQELRRHRLEHGSNMNLAF
jgi:hypothetical protein